jgi:hypothetical protein
MRTRRTLDTARIAEAVKAKGIDLRFWSSHGTVGTVGEDGVFDPTDPHAVIVAPEGLLCDVLLEPLNLPITARYAGMGGRSCVVMAPIRPGDEVLVVIPDGDLANHLAIVAVLNNDEHRIPIDPTDRKPVFRNDRLSIYAVDVPIEVRNAAGATVRLEVAGDIVLAPSAGKHVKAGGTTDLERAALGDTLQARLEAIETWGKTHTHPVAGVSVGAGAVVSAFTEIPIGPTPKVTSETVQVKK